jgi:hypothetical protein
VTASARPSGAARVAAALCLAVLGPIAIEAQAAAASPTHLDPTAIVSPADASSLEAFAAREVRRYFYVRTGRLLPIQPDATGAAIVVAGRDRAAVRGLADARLTTRLGALAPQERMLVTVQQPGRSALLVTGGDEAGVLYAAYRLAERLGVRFGLHGDTLPDDRCPTGLPDFDETDRPLFAIRGIQPFHDFPEGPDWWSRDDYKAILGQLPKLGMNFFGLHTYPESRPNAEPTVWIGPPDEIAEGAEVKAAYASSYFTTLRGNWGYEAKPTGDYALGASWLFHRGGYGNDVMEALAPQPWNVDDARLLFARAAEVLKDAFGLARRLATKTCVGTETPLVVPRAVADRLARAGLKAVDPGTTERLYEGMFRRIAQAYPLDYFWLWTPEGWTWEGVSDAEVKATVDDLRRALSAAQRTKAPFSLATCGWVLGPPQDRTLFDRELPKDVALSCINRTVGQSPVERGFAAVRGRPTWAIPWLEDDPALTSPQLWAGRMRRDAGDARRYGTTGLIGIHWRTRAIGPNVAALAQAAWRQDWPPGPLAVEGPIGGHPEVRAAAAVAGVGDPALYRSQRCALAGYRVRVPKGRYAVTLRFAELAFDRPGQRVFDVTVEGRTVLAGLDLAKTPGPGRAFDHVAPGVEVTDGWLDVGFVDHHNVACLAALEVEGKGLRRRINVGGPAVAGYEADPAGLPFVPTADFWRDWAGQEFGPEVGAQAAAIFERLDSRMPRPANWIDGPGGIEPDERAWDEAKADYAFVGELEALRPLVRGAASQERFGYWLETFRYMRAMGELRCAYARQRTAVAAIRVAATASERKLRAEAALEALRAMVPIIERLHRHLYATVTTRGEMGTVANWQQHVLPRVFEAPAREIAQALGRDLPEDARLAGAYRGPERLVVPTVRTSLEPGEPLRLEAIVLGDAPARSVTLRWRPMGAGSWSDLPFAPVARGVWRARLAPRSGDFEYVIEAESNRGTALRFPAAGTDSPQTVVVGP